MMNLIRRLFPFILLTQVLFYLSCQKEYSCEGCGIGNVPPVAIAGPDQTTPLPTDIVSLDGSGSSDPDGLEQINVRSLPGGVYFFKTAIGGYL